MRTIWLVPSVFALLLAVLGVYLFQIDTGARDVRAVPSVLIDKPAPDFVLPAIDGIAGGLAREDLVGRVSLVNVFASWCVPCRSEMPVLERLAKEGVAIYGIDVKDKPEDARDFLDRYGNPFAKVGADHAGRTAIDWGVYGYPETFLIDATGRIRYKHVGPIMPHEVDETILPMIREIAG